MGSYKYTLKRKYNFHLLYSKKVPQNESPESFELIQTKILTTQESTKFCTEPDVLVEFNPLAVPIPAATTPPPLEISCG